MTRKVRVGVIGLGKIGTRHAATIAQNAIEGAELTAVHARNEGQVKWVKDNIGEHIAIYDNEKDFFASNEIDAVIIASPHYYHADQAIQAFEQGLHVLCEKPADVYTKQVRLMNEAAAASGKVFSMMYNQRTFPIYRKIRDLIISGELGEIKRTNWIMTNWYRAQSYYDAVSWRGTWASDGGGVLINQDIHQLDLWQWVTGMMPTRIRAHCYFGKYKKIEVEDDVTAFVEYENGATGVFVTTTGESPGTNRLEINGDRGKLVMEDGKLTLWRLRMPEPEFNQSYTGGRFDQPESWKMDIPVAPLPMGQNHDAIIQNWVDAIAKGTPLIAPGNEGMKGLMLCNAMLLSTWTDGWVDLPMDEDLYYEHLQRNIAAVQEVKNT